MDQSWRRGVMALACAMAISAPRAFADWPDSARVVCDDPANQFLPMMAPDGAGGAFVAWGDARGLTAYCSRVMRNGFLAPGWATNGIVLGEGNSYYGQGRGVPDGAGGAYFAWASDPVASVDQILLQHVTPAGGIVTGWPASGLVLGTTAGIGLLPRVAIDGTGGVYVCWYENPALRIQRVQTDGTLSPNWPASGALVTNVPGSFQNPFVIEDGSGGAVVTWTDVGSGTGDVRAQRIDPDGSRSSGWPADGFLVCGESGAQAVNGIIADNSGGAWLVWGDDRNSGTTGRDIYTERISGSGAPAIGWPAGGIPVCEASGAQITPRIASDGSGGAFVAWIDRRAGVDGDPYLQHIGADGAPIAGWPADGTPICAASGVEQLSLDSVIGDGFGGAIVVWSDARDTLSTGRDVYAQRFDSDGSVHTGWTSNGVALCASPGDQVDVHCVSDGSGGAIVAWQDGRTGHSNNQDIYAIGVRGDGTTPARVSLVRAGAGGGRVTLDWYAPLGLPGGATVERRVAESGWTALAPAICDGVRHVRFVDDDVSPGTRYGYRIVSDGAPLTADTWVDVPRPARDLLVAAADPEGVVTVRYSLRGFQPANLQLFDVAGRCLRSAIAGRVAPEVQETRFAGALPAGLYWVRLTQGGRIATARVVVLE